MAGRPQLRIATHGKIKRIYRGGGIWLARCRYRDTDGVSRVVQKLGPADEYDKYGKGQPKGAVALTADQLRDLLVNLQTSEFCEKHDLVDPITLLIATGIRRSELLALRWSDFDEKTAMLTVAGKVIRVAGEGLLRVDDTKSAAGRRTIPLPRFAVEMLQKRRHLPTSASRPSSSRPQPPPVATRTTS